MSKKLERIKHRRENLEELIWNKFPVFCVKHQDNITLDELYRHRCYLGNHGQSYCKYLRLDTHIKSEYDIR